MLSQIFLRKNPPTRMGSSMRYSVVSTGVPIEFIVAQCLKHGATGIKPVKLAHQVFCDLEPRQAMKLDDVPGIIVKEVQQLQAFGNGGSGGVGTLTPPVRAESITAAGDVLNMYSIFSELWAAYDPPLIGNGLTVAVLDTGIRDTHNSLKDKVLLSVNMTSTPSAGDTFGHGTNVAHIIAGLDGAHSGVAPGAKLINIKILDDFGLGSEEDAVHGIAYVCSLVEAAIQRGELQTADSYPNTINISAGAPDLGDSTSPLRIACKAAKEEYGLQIIGAAGNMGPDPQTILLPACDASVIAVGGINSYEFSAWEKSSRGPTINGLTKPDLVLWTTGIEGASHLNDTDYVSKDGTSFSAPIVSGIHGLIWELTRRVYGDAALLDWYDIMSYGPLYFVKPEGAPVTKDNIYGLGAPAISSVISKLISGGGGGSTSQIMEPLMSVMMMGMMMKMMSGIT